MDSRFQLARLSLVMTLFVTSPGGRADVPTASHMQNSETRPCVTLDREQSEKWLQDKKSLVFFASWCHACKPHLEKAKAARGAGIVLVFDRPERGERVLRELGIEAPCVISSHIEEKFNISSLPRLENLD